MSSVLARIPDFTVPSDDVRWCAALAEALSVCCIAPVDYRVAEVRALLAALPVQELPMAWHDLVELAREWQRAIDAFGIAAPFLYGTVIERALRDKPCAVPAWAERYQ